MSFLVGGLCFACGALFGVLLSGLLSGASEGDETNFEWQEEVERNKND